MKCCLRPPRRRGPLWMLAALALPPAAGCGREPSAPARLLAPASPMSTVMHLGGHRLAATAGHNGCGPMVIDFRELPMHPLTSESLTNIPAFHDPLCDPDSVEVMDNMFSCALPEGAAISTTLADSTVIEFKGHWGLAPEWAAGPCDVACQEWVSACVALRFNIYGIHVWLNTAAPKPGTLYDHPAAPDPGSEFSNQEGAFFGSMFGSLGPALYACRGRGADPFYAAMRRCSLPGSTCKDAVTAIGSCDGFNGATGETTDEFACEGGLPGGYFTRCHSRVGRAGAMRGVVYTRPITVFTETTRWGRSPAGCRP